MMAPAARHETRLRDHELEAWLDRALGMTRPDPEPVLHDLDE